MRKSAPTGAARRCHVLGGFVDSLYGFALVPTCRNQPDKHRVGEGRVSDAGQRVVKA